MEFLQNIEIWRYVIYFFIYAFFGWILEVAYHAISCGDFVNRGFLAGFYCPIYGTGAVLIFLALEPIKDNLLFLFIGSVVICSIIEFVVGFVLDKIFHKRWWDYTDMPFNLEGYICAKFSIYWGIGGVFLIREIHTTVARLVEKIDFRILVVLSVVLIIYIIIDTLAAVQNILKLNRRLKMLSEMREQIYEFSNFIGEGVSDATLDISKRAEPIIKEATERKDEFDKIMETRKEELGRKIYDSREEFGNLIETRKEEFEKRIEVTKEELEKKMDDRIRGIVEERYRILSTYRKGEKRIIRAYPKITDKLYKEEFEELRKIIESRANRL